MGMKRLLSKSSICIFLVALFLFEAFCFETPVQAKKKSIKTPTISLSKCNDDAGIKIKIKKTKKAQAYEVYVCPVNTISLYEGCAADAFYVEGIPENSLDDNWHEKGVYYKQAEVKSTGEKYQYYICNPELTRLRLEPIIQQFLVDVFIVIILSKKRLR